MKAQQSSFYSRGS